MAAEFSDLFPARDTLFIAPGPHPLPFPVKRPGLHSLRAKVAGALEPAAVVTTTGAGVK